MKYELINPELDQESIRSSPRNCIGSISNWSLVTLGQHNTVTRENHMQQGFYRIEKLIQK